MCIVGYNYWGQWYTMTLGVTLACGYVFTISCLAAALLPYRAKALYEASPGAKYTLGGIPLVTIFGAIGFVFGLWAMVMFLTNPAYVIKGSGSWVEVWTPYIVVGGIFLLCRDRLLDRSRLQQGQGHRRQLRVPRGAAGVNRLTF